MVLLLQISDTTMVKYPKEKSVGRRFDTKIGALGFFSEFPRVRIRTSNRKVLDSTLVRSTWIFSKFSRVGIQTSSRKVMGLTLIQGAVGFSPTFPKTKLRKRTSLDR